MTKAANRPISPKPQPTDAIGDPTVRQFCQERKLAPHVPLILRLIDEYFDLAAAPRLSVEDDPEIDEQRLEVTIVARGGPDEVLRDYQRFTRELLTAFPPDALDAVRVSLDVA